MGHNCVARAFPAVLYVPLTCSAPVHFHHLSCCIKTRYPSTCGRFVLGNRSKLEAGANSS